VTREQALEIIKRESDLYPEDSVDSVEWLEVYKALEQQPSDDCVSRQAVLDEIKSMSNANPSYWATCDVIDREDLIDNIQALPPVTPTFPKGATNGDIIKAMFNCMVIDISKGKVYVEHIYFPFDEEWWNAPYKRGNENGI